MGKYPPTGANPLQVFRTNGLIDYFLVILLPVEIVSEKSLKLLPPDITLKSKMHSIRFRLGFRPRPYGALTALS